MISKIPVNRKTFLRRSIARKIFFGVAPIIVFIAGHTLFALLIMAHNGFVLLSFLIAFTAPLWLFWSYPPITIFYCALPFLTWTILFTNLRIPQWMRIFLLIVASLIIVILTLLGESHFAPLPAPD